MNSVRSQRALAGTALVRSFSGMIEDRPDGRHSLLAMQAARKMSRLRKQARKEKMGHMVCHHLLRMLADPDGDLSENDGSLIGRQQPEEGVEQFALL